jgi:biotin carboxylase
MRQGILLLSHCGFSFMEDLIAATGRQGRAALVLSSRPITDAEPRLETLAGLADRVIATGAHALTWADVAHALDQLQAEGWRIEACVSVWEGYRGLMAQANRRLGVPDLTPETVARITDKLWLRLSLAECGLTRVQAEPASAAALRRWQEQGRPGFVKPRRGIASYGARRLRPGLTMAALEAVRNQLVVDTLYADLLADAEFFIEDYIDGPEYSFEVIALNGRPYLIGVHQKLQVTETEHTVLEDCCVSPPPAWDAVTARRCQDWLGRLMAATAANWGCFHIEARLTDQGWELIEINPRVGGALISDSVAVQTGGQSLLDYWLRALLAGDAWDSAALGADLMALQNAYPHPRASFFRVYFARPGTIAAIRRGTMKQQPDSIQCFLEPGTTVEESAREVFLGQALWSFEYADRDTAIPDLVSTSEDALSAVYLD